MSKNPQHIGIVYGTRPEAIKLAPLINALASKKVALSVINTGQHRDLLDKTEIGLPVETTNLAVMQEGQSLPELYGRCVQMIAEQLRVIKPAVLVVHGDTATSTAAALAASLEKVPVAHVEAGLRTHDRNSPFPEELNRTLTATMASVHFAPTKIARQNLLAEGVPGETIHITGNTIVDSTRIFFDRFLSSSEWTDQSLTRLKSVIGWDPSKETYLLVTLHRRENAGIPMEQILDAIRRVAELKPHLKICFPVHPNPIISGVARTHLGDLRNVRLLSPLAHADFMTMMAYCAGVVTDSGGLQEEAVTLGKRVIVTRESTERPEIIQEDLGVITGGDSKRVFSAIQNLVDSTTHSSSMLRLNLDENPFGDGYAAEKISEVLVRGSLPTQ